MQSRYAANDSAVTAVVDRLEEGNSLGFTFSNDHLRTLVDHLPTLVAFWDKNLICRFANREYSLWFGVDHLQLIGTTMEALVGPELFALNTPMIQAALSGQRQDFERLLVGADGVARNTVVTYLPAIVDGTTTGFIVHITEVNRLKQVEDALRREIAEHQQAIEELNLAGERLRAKEEAFRQTLSLNGQIPWEASADGSVATIHPLWADQWAALTGHHGKTALDASLTAVVYQDDRERARANVQRAANDLAPTDHRYRIGSPDKGYRWMRFLGAPNLDEAGNVTHWLGTVEDIDDSVRAEAEQQERDVAYRLTIDLSGLIPWTTTSDGGMFSIAGAAAARWAILTGRPATEPVASLYNALIHPEDGKSHRANPVVDITTGRPIDRRVRLRMHDGQYRWWRWRGSPQRDAKGEIVRWHGTLEDIHDHVLSEERVRRLEAEVSYLGRIAAMDSMASTLAHELNQPLAAAVNYIAGARQLLANGGATELEDVADALVSASDCTMRAGEVIRSLRAMVAKGSPQGQSQDLATLIERACLLAMYDAAGKGISLAVEIDQGAETIFADRLQVEQVLVNLLRNAVEALAEAHVRLIRITARPNGCNVDISVVDTGPGVADDIVGELFNAFKTTKTSGLGIGLAICRTMIEANAGRISHARGPNGGACFTFTLPGAQ